jgi:hypothetical protein
VAHDIGLAPLGTAGHHRGFLLVDVPLPWPPDIGDVAGLAPVKAALKGTGVRLQGVVPAPGDDRRVVLYHRPPGDDFAGYERVEWRAPADGVVEAALGLLAEAVPEARVPAGVGAEAGAGRPPSLGGQGRPGAATGVTGSGRDAGPGPTGPHGDLLVCTHGRRDVCCGSSGTVLAVGLMADPDVAAAGYVVGRTSHTGGHRFAPTAIVLPDATMWAFLDAEMAGRVVRRDGDVAGLLDHYRGSTGIGSAAVQAVERVAFAEVGWEWLDWRRRGEDLGDGRARVTGTAPDGTRRTWEATVTTTKRPVPDCGHPIEESRKTQPEPHVGPVTRT